MGKPSNFPLVQSDFYPTPHEAAQPLIPHLDRIRHSQNRLGDGDLVRHLDLFGLRRISPGDIAIGQDALELTSAYIAGAPIITNSPFKSEDPNHYFAGCPADSQPIAPVTWLLLPLELPVSNQWFETFSGPRHRHCCDRPG